MVKSAGLAVTASVDAAKPGGLAFLRIIVPACAGQESWMRSRSAVVLLFISLGRLFSLAQNDNALDAKGTSVTDNSYVPVHKFDPKRDAAADIQAAIAEAQKTGKRIILDVGGDWCQYCHQMDQFFQDHPAVLQLRENNFITVAIFYSSDNKNEKALSHYSKVLGIPHFFVLERDGILLHSQHVTELRINGSYNTEKMKDFLTKWAPAAGAKGHEE